MSENSLLQEADYRRQSFWLDSVPGSLAPRPALEGDQDADVVVIGAGYTGLWTAYYLKRHAPDLNIAVLEANIAGYGASGRNGGWCSAYLSCMDNWLENPETRSEAIALQRLMFDAVDEVGRVAEREQIDCHFVKGGHVDWAESSAQLARCQEEVEWWHELGVGEDDIRWMEPGEIKNRINVSQDQGQRLGHRDGHKHA